MNKKTVLLYLCIALFGIVGIYLTFIAGNTKNFDSQTKAYSINPNESYDSDSGTIYNPIYYFKVNGKEYECKAKSGSSSAPSESKNIVYYDSNNPKKCLTEYEKSTNKFAGIICLIATAIMIYFFVIKKTSNSSEDFNHMQETNAESHHQYEENAEKVIDIIEKFQLIYKRVILGIIIVILLVVILFDTTILKQTIISKDYPEVIAVYVDKKNESDSKIFEDYIYTFKDKQEVEQEITVSISKDESPKDEIKIKYNEKNPQDYYGEGSTMNISGIIWYILKVIIMILLIFLFFNKKLLSKINLFIRKN